MIVLSELDRLRFGHVTAKAEIGEHHDLAALMDHCKAAKVQLLIARCPTHLLAPVQAMEGLGFFLTDTLMYWRKDKLGKSGSADALPNGFTARAADPADAKEVERVAAEAFRGYVGHYHMDARLERARCDAVYASWAARLCKCTDDQAHMVVVTANVTGRIAGFAAMQPCGDGEFDGTLFGVHPTMRGQGVFGALLRLAQQWGIRQGLGSMQYSTQLTNFAVQRTLCRQGFEPQRSVYTFHKWFD